MKRLTWLFASLLAALVPALANASPGVVVANVNLRAGPDVSYPRINTVPAGAPVDIQGCTEGYEWCDVIVGPDRGWIAAGYLQFVYQSQPVIVQDYGPRIGVPIVSFVIGTYWGQYYANRPFYRERNYWYRRPIVHRPPPRPPIHRPPPRPNPGWGGHRPPPPRPGPPPGQGHRPPGGDHRPPGGGGSRPPGDDHRPPGGGNNRPPGGGGHKPPTQGGGRPPGQGGQRPGKSDQQRPQPKPAGQ
ncbi:MAG TPA: SH3 domain-containing protein [Dyella sp.]|uniref:SH3 domain-containing protein n=1 Tax=Dyella sp. TaxID=1869338 RepID=UPI002F95C2C8